jgi:uncharacterized protein HemY
MRHFIWLLIIFLIAVWLGTNIALDPGYVLIAYSHWTIETPLWAFVIGLLLIFFIIFFLLRVSRNIRSLPQRWRTWFTQRRLSSSERATYAYQMVLRKLDSEMDLNKLQNIWYSLPRKLRLNSLLVLHYAKALIKCGAPDTAEVVVRKNIQKNFAVELVHYYGLVNATQRDRQLVCAEKWLLAHKDDAVLLLTCGRLCIRNELWGKARSYLQTSIAIAPQPETYLELAKLTEKLGDEKLARDYYRKGLEINETNAIPTK